MKIYIIRHGETNMNKDHIFQGRYDEPLNMDGIKLANITGEALKGIHFDVAYSSPLKRSIKTIECVLEKSNNFNTPIIIDNRLIEVDVGDWTLKNIQNEDDKDYLKYNQFFKNPFFLEEIPNGESVFDVIKRTQEFLLELINKNDDKTYLVGTHGFALRAMLNMFYENKTDFWQEHVPYNCCINIIEAKDNNVSLIAKDICYYSNIKDLYKEK